MSNLMRICFAFILSFVSIITHASEITVNNANYAQYSRSENPPENFLEYRFQQQFWRAKTLQKLLNVELTSENAKSVLNNLRELRVTLNPDQLEALHDKIENLLNDREIKTLYLTFLENIAASSFINDKFGLSSKLAGPSLLKIKPIKPSKYSFKKWSQVDQQDNYSFEDGGVRFRGILFRPGDTLLTSLNMNSSGLYTTFSSPVGHFSHAGYFAILETDGKKFPAVIEIYERGVRAVPLNVFTSEKFSSYIEVYRYNDLNPEAENRINISARQLMDKVHGYNFYTEDNDELYLTCTEVGTWLMKDSGLSPVEAISKITNKQSLKNFSLLGFNDQKVLAPIDIALSKKMHFVNFIDNNLFYKNAVTELVVKRIRNEFETKNLNIIHFPFSFKFNNWAIKQIQSRRFILAPLFRLVEGFSKTNFPKGPQYMMALVEPLEGIMDKIVENSYEEISEIMAHESNFSIHQCYENTEINEVIKSHSKKLDKLFL